MADPRIALERVTKTYGAHQALANVSLEIAAGEFVALVGASGSGKTTLLKTINGLITPDGGEVRIEGEAVDALTPHLLRRRIGYVFQEVGLFPHLTVAENISITPKLLAWEKDRRAARAAELLDLVALPQEMGARFPSALSGGQQQRIGVARALAAEPHIVLMDEPFGALDPLTRDALGDDYRALHERLNLSTVMVTHDMTEALLLADRIVVVAHGRVIADGAPQTLAASSDPDVAALLAAPRRQAERLRARLGDAA
jgi:osmoprotectant transport system ATP-binding protein